jgi:alcohol dehydrogenase class IV
MKLAGDQLLFGAGTLAYLKNLRGRRAVIVTGGGSMQKSGILDAVTGYLREAGFKDVGHISGVESDPSFATVRRGALEMAQISPEWIVALGGGSVMDAAKAMWVFYERPDLTGLADLLPPNRFPVLRQKARCVCIPSTAGTASEVSRSIVITDDYGFKVGIGNFEMMPDLAICDPAVTLTMPPNITAETGMDALTHAAEALVSVRANYVSDALARRAARDIFEFLPKAYNDGRSMFYREKMLNASMAAGLAFTNVSLGIVHSMAHALGGMFGLSHGLLDAVILPYVAEFNSADECAYEAYRSLAESLGEADFAAAVRKLNKSVGIPERLSDVIPNEAAYLAEIDKAAALALKDGCTKTSPVIPDAGELVRLLKTIYYGNM